VWGRFANSGAFTYDGNMPHPHADRRLVRIIHMNSAASAGFWKKATAPDSRLRLSLPQRMCARHKDPKTGWPTLCATTTEAAQSRTGPNTPNSRSMGVNKCYGDFASSDRRYLFRIPCPEWSLLTIR
jgi:hypothetical protein